MIPSLPKEWPKGSISGIQARGQLNIEKLAWDVPEGVINLSLTSGKKQTLTLRLPPDCHIKSAKVLSGEAHTDPVSGKGNYLKLSLSAEDNCHVQIEFQE